MSSLPCPVQREMIQTPIATLPLRAPLGVPAWPHRAPNLSSVVGSSRRSQTGDTMSGRSGRNVRKATKWLKVDAPITPATPATPISPVANFPPFIPATRLVTYLRENLPRILIELFQNEDDRPFEQEILNGDHCYTRIFAILLLIEQPWLIVEFLDKPNLSDHSGPFYGENPPPEFPEGANWEEFKKQQWQFFAHSFNRHGRDLKIDSNVPLPFVAVSRISSGGSAHIYKVTVEPEYNAMFESPVSEPRDFALKEFYGQDAGLYYEREVHAFRKIRSARNTRDAPENKNVANTHVVEYFTSFQYAGRYYVILELCHGNLREYFTRERHPQRIEDKITFWEQFSKIVQGIFAIHSSHADSTALDQHMDGFHQDLKLENILYTIPPNSEPFAHDFKVADLGLSHFKVGGNGAPIYARDTQGTKTYGAPETYRAECMEETKLAITNKADIWSLACIFSTALAWSVFGSSEIERYAEYRRKETAKRHLPPNSDCFHDGRRVLDSVEQEHHYLRDQCREDDFITPKLLDLVSDILEKPDPNARMSAHSLVFEIQSVIREARDERKKWFGRRIGGARPPPHTASTWAPDSAVSNSVPRPRMQPPTLPPVDEIMSSGLPAADSQTLSRHGLAPGSSRRGEQDAAFPFGRPTGHPTGHPPSFPGTRESNPGYATAVPKDPWNPNSRHFVDEPAEGGPSSSGVAITPAQPPQHPDSHRQIERLPESLLPELSIKQAEDWIRERKRWTWLQKMFKRSAPTESLPDLEQHLSRLRDRDHIFILDDEGLIKPHWPEVCKLLGILAYLVKGKDADGLDMFLANSGHRTHSKKSSVLVATARDREPSLGLVSNLFDFLELLLQGYRKVMGSKKKRLSIYIFTTANWAENCPAGRIDESIEGLVKSMVKSGLRDRRVAIQMIQFGNDTRGTERLEYLDNLKDYNPEVEIDIVDTEKSNGNILKMLLGGTDDVWDERPSNVASYQRH